MPLWTVGLVAFLASLIAFYTGQSYSLNWIIGYNVIISGAIAVVYGVEKFILKREIEL